jgi:hypothetical protein
VYLQGSSKPVATSKVNKSAPTATVRQNPKTAQAEKPSEAEASKPKVEDSKPKAKTGRKPAKGKASPGNDAGEAGAETIAGRVAEEHDHHDHPHAEGNAASTEGAGTAGKSTDAKEAKGVSKPKAKPGRKPAKAPPAMDAAGAEAKTIAARVAIEHDHHEHPHAEGIAASTEGAGEAGESTDAKEAKGVSKPKAKTGRKPAKVSPAVEAADAEAKAVAARVAIEHGHHEHSHAEGKTAPAEAGKSTDAEETDPSKTKGVSKPKPKVGRKPAKDPPAVEAAGDEAKTIAARVAMEHEHPHAEGCHGARASPQAASVVGEAGPSTAHAEERKPSEAEAVSKPKAKGGRKPAKAKAAPTEGGAGWSEPEAETIAATVATEHEHPCADGDDGGDGQAAAVTGKGKTIAERVVEEHIHHDHPHANNSPAHYQA